MKQKYIDLYMDWAKRASELSYAQRLQVGAVIVKNDTVISYGYNGMPSGWDNNCEHTVTEFSDAVFGESQAVTQVLKTKPEVLHAEMNALMKLARSNESGLDASIFITHSPCIECSKGIYQAGIKEVYYANDYRDNAGVEFLQKCGILVTKM